MDSFVDRAEEEAKHLLSRSAYDYYAGGAGDERTTRDNIIAFRRIFFVPRFFRNISNIDSRTVIRHVGKLSIPVMIAPIAMQKMANPVGELGVRRAASQFNIPYILSTFSTTSLKTIATDHESANTSLLFQLYFFKNRDVTRNLLIQAKAHGYKVIVLTVDAAKFGRRETDPNNTFKLPENMYFDNFGRDEHINKKADAKKGQPTTKNSGFNEQLEDELSLQDIKWIIGITGLPVWVKGILHPSDAKDVINAGASGVVVSNHGGRQLEGTIPTMDALPSIVKAVQGKATVLVDSGIRTGEDVVKAIAMGADAVLLGRPVLWALATNGTDGVVDLLKRITHQVELTMALCGVDKVRDISRDLVRVSDKYVGKL